MFVTFACAYLMLMDSQKKLGRMLDAVDLPGKSPNSWMQLICLASFLE